jgi:glutamine amidotransferase
MSQIVIVDYGMGNLRSVEQAFLAVGGEPVRTSDLSIIASAKKLVLPGQGELGNAIRRIDGLGLRDILIDRVNSGVPLLGICVGFQLLFDSGEEAPSARLLSLIPGDVPKFPDGMIDEPSGARLKIPQMGWNFATVKTGCPLTDDISSGAYFYFVHSYYCRPKSDTVASLTVRYGDVEYCAMAADETNGRRLYATQFHPEKSQRAGLNILKRFVGLPV